MTQRLRYTKADEDRLRAEAARTAPDESGGLGAVYEWLVAELGYPFDMCTDKPPWLDVDRLAEAWARHDGDTAENYRLTILAETGWPDDSPDPVEH